MESTNVKNIKHSYDLIHSTPQVSELTSIYNKKFQNILQKKNLILPNQLNNELKFCQNCNGLFIPGINMKMEIKYTKTKKSKKQEKKVVKKQWKPRDRNLIYTCLLCNYKTKFELLKPEKNPNEIGIDIKDKEPFIAKWEPKSQEDKKKNSAKDRAKKRKKNNLLNLLQDKKLKDEQDKKKSNLLSLDEFMKS
ncbi:Ribonuclease MRP protein subunit [Wickerhamomyces ciferrii]|uniref:Ribonuclease MRP protein subunit n=1 Tax=Wickerhamomyces ciferrii (strain ATCC 14091 / BCRC 22168 / CBS 111 / JCM 3599 / NBRC 0793 / NRRL Y-1031 F-60-10) TaxID=1206466 RepID=K0KTP5_WICCF|nr:Ribonuclease MRP protein subunit [Wickerhamomyces ciferrii]CCH44633.1 Ribonuclease MRP protein subunit [Wickerhamomyces ciferrii]